MTHLNLYQCTVPQNINLLLIPYYSFVRVIMFITNRKYNFFCITKSDYYLTIITLIHWFKIVHVLL